MGGVCGSQDAKPSTESVDPIPMDPPAPAEEPKPVAQKFFLTVVGAKGLRNADWMPGTGKSDSYVEVKCNDKVLHTTKVINDCLDPIWDEECEIEELDDGATLEFEIYDKDIIKSTSLGKVVLESSVFAEGFNSELEVKDPDKGADAEAAYLKIKIKKSDGEYPSYISPEFTISAEKPSAEAVFGLDFDLQDGTTLYVKTVKDGPFKEYNDSKPEAEKMKKGDYIVKVNGIQGKTEELLAQFRNELKVECLVRRGITQTIIFEKPKEGPIGLKFFEQPTGEFLTVLTVEEEGAAAKHNESADEAMKFLPGDRIISVAGSKGKASDLFSTIKEKTGKYKLLVERPAVTNDGLSASAKYLWS